MSAFTKCLIAVACVFQTVKKFHSEAIRKLFPATLILMCIVSFVDMRGLMTCCGKILRIRPSHILAVNCNNLKATHLSDCWKFLSIGPTEIECENDFSNLSS